MRAGCGRFTIGLITPLAGLDHPMASDNLNYWSCRSHTQTRTRTLAAYHQLMLHTDTNEENLSGFLKLLDTALQHEVRRRKASCSADPAAWASLIISKAIVFEAVWGVLTGPGLGWAV